MRCDKAGIPSGPPSLYPHISPPSLPPPLNPRTLPNPKPPTIQKVLALHHPPRPARRPGLRRHRRRLRPDPRAALLRLGGLAPLRRLHHRWRDRHAAARVQPRLHGGAAGGGRAGGDRCHPPAAPQPELGGLRLGAPGGGGGGGGGGDLCVAVIITNGKCVRGGGCRCLEGALQVTLCVWVLERAARALQDCGRECESRGCLSARTVFCVCWGACTASS